MEQWRRLRHIKCLLYHSVTVRMLLLPSRLYASLASELFCPQLTPHVCYLVLPHLVTFDFPLTPLLAYLSDVLPTSGLPPSLQLLYSLTQLVNPKLGEGQKLVTQFQTHFVLFSYPPPLSSSLLPFPLLSYPFIFSLTLFSSLLPCHLSPGSLSPASLSQYLRLLAVLLNHAPRVRATSRGGEEEEEEQGWIMEVEGEPDPLGSHDELLACCLAGVTGEHLPNRLRQER